MKTLKALCIVCIALLTFNCSKDDNKGSSKKTNEELLASGKWYQESKTPGSYTACEKKGYIQFMDNGDLIINSFDDNSGTCESSGAVTAAYTLTNDININIVFGSDNSSAVINSISEDRLTVTVDTGETEVFDKTQG